MSHPPDFVDEIWRVELPSDSLGAHAILPDTRCGIALVVFSNGVVSQILPSLPHVRVRFAPIIPGAKVAGVYFKPGRAPLTCFSDEDEAATATFWSDVAQALAAYAQDTSRREGVSTALSQLAERLPPPDQVILSALQHDGEGGPDRIYQLAAELGLSERQFRRRFIAATGLSPRAFVVTSRLHLSLVALSRSPEPQLASTACDAGYADQSHWGRSVQKAFDRSLLRAHRELRAHRARFQGRHLSEKF
ncbi:helix-turn-helix domain-containing protein [Caulobacter hibisci]|uniref:AraC family transcriptional regulator n=1 Tax=Caulobacter hibisci TaxID=2035993 RepID=A0ABS0SZD4_9CAUL|nr:AraC family transcriptional regulator [Caulobacter hibisci]